MKEAMWGAGIMALGLFVLVMVNLFGNITVTNQLNYTSMKNAVQGAMLDSLDLGYYRAGFCLCKADGGALSKDGITTFNSESEYVLRDIVDDSCGEDENGSCALIYGGYRLNKQEFEKNFEDRFMSVINNNKEYSYQIKNITEYPPEVGVIVTSTDEYFFETAKSEYGGYNIVNEWDAIIEAGSGHVKFLEKDEGEGNNTDIFGVDITSKNICKEPEENTGSGGGSCNKWHYGGSAKCSGKVKYVSSKYGSHNSKTAAESACKRALSGCSNVKCTGYSDIEYHCKGGSTQITSSRTCPCFDGCVSSKCLG